MSDCLDPNGQEPKSPLDYHRLLAKWAPDSWAPGPNCRVPDCPGPNLPRTVTMKKVWKVYFQKYHDHHDPHHQKKSEVQFAAQWLFPKICASSLQNSFGAEKLWNFTENSINTMKYQQMQCIAMQINTKQSWDLNLWYKMPYNYNAFSHHWQGSIDFNAVNTTRPAGMYIIHHTSWYFSRNRFIKTFSSALEIYLN